MGDPVEQWLEDCLTLPGKLHRALRLMAHLEQEVSRIETQFRVREKEYLGQLRQSQQQGTPRPAPEQDEEIGAIKRLHFKCRALLREKVVVNKQIASFIHHEQQRLVKERDKLLHSMHGLGAAANLKSHSVSVSPEPGAAVAAPGHAASGVAGAGAVGPPSSGAFGSTHGGGSAGGSTVGRSALRRRGTDRSAHLSGASSDAALVPGGGPGPDRAGLGLDGDGSFYPRGADRGGFNGEFQTGAPSAVSSAGAGSTAGGRARQQGGPHGLMLATGGGPGACPPSAGSDVSVGSSTVHPPPKKARKAHDSHGASASRLPSSQSSTVTAGAVGTAGAAPGPSASHPIGGAPGGGEGRGSVGVSLSPGLAHGAQASGSKSGGSGRSRHHPSHSGRSRHDGSRAGSTCPAPAVSGTPTPAFASSHRLGPSPYYPSAASPALDPSGAHTAMGSGSALPGGAAGPSMASSGAGTAPSESADTWEGICPVCHKGESSECNNMVACDACNQWFHFECVGYSAETHEDDAWFCPQCYQNGLVP
ncbi:putative PHD-finger domain-containing protein [Neospora caninum Liverpool]|uniref:Inhibitor of growth protein n=1 Tax=Neospora caninum (strain Liverpool) TaxID=572307 RepID=F0V7X1_NEOCL|nr:putative PHD-finger domain-containing protein [Neospora caninum Liverpool]CBZ49812.1 putative PHD-finger domain-containing protein [Neospora caninum Liverpool]CEL64400.1 TPA: PHD-finger domain-containing protein, putative [Neospora caninum Liverpool]|eukprot:XP_003879847.1 putative PHD-finger domain-containing protein [Neospora caninum Liverpool]